MKNKKIKKGLCICTPFYGEDVKVQYMTSLVETYAEFQKAGIPLMNIYLYNTSLITKARNTLASKFMEETNFEYMIFIDSDISWKASSLLKLINYDKEIIGATYPKKIIDWKEIQKAIINNQVESPKDLLEKTSHYTIWDKKQKVMSNGLMEVERLGTGFMMLKRTLLAKMENHYPDLMYKMEKEKGQINEKRKKGFGFFDSRLIYKEHISEDYSFCEYVKETDTNIYIDPKIILSHHGGNISFFGNYLKHIDYGNSK